MFYSNFENWWSPAPLSFVTSIHFYQQAMNFNWFNTSCVQNRISARTSHLGNSILNGRQAKDESLSKAGAFLFVSEWSTNHISVVNSCTKSFPATSPLWRLYFWNSPRRFQQFLRFYQMRTPKSWRVYECKRLEYRNNKKYSWMVGTGTFITRLFFIFREEPTWIFLISRNSFSYSHKQRRSGQIFGTTQYNFAINYFIHALYSKAANFLFLFALNCI